MGYIKLRNKAHIVPLLFIGDAILAFASTLLSILWLVPVAYPTTERLFPLPVTVIYVLLFLGFYYIYGMYELPTKPPYDVFVTNLIVLFFLSAVFIFADFFSNPLFFSKRFIFLDAVFLMVLLSAWRIGCDRVLSRASARRKTALVYCQDDGPAFMDKVSQMQMFSIVERINVDQWPREQRGQLVAKLLANVDTVLISSLVSSNKKELIVSQAFVLGADVITVPNVYEMSIHNAVLMRFDDVPAFGIEPFGLPIYGRFLKRMMDIGVSAVAIVLLAPVMCVCAAAIRLNSHGPVLYRQERVTRWGKTFRLCKFRTMVIDAEQKSGPVLSTGDEDPRVTSVGRFLRRTRLDELPQLFNILGGSMSLVGPRPERPIFVEQFIAEFPYYNQRHRVKAGLTGMAQVYGRYNTLPQDKLLYDLMYISEASVLLDMRILLLTLRTIFLKSSTQGAGTQNANAYWDDSQGNDIHTGGL